MTDEQGRQVDVDLIDGVEAFDGWRIWGFLYDGNDGDLSVEELSAACSAMAGWGELREVREGRWFGLLSSDASSLMHFS